MLTVVPGEGSGHEGGKDGSSSLIDEIVREGARRMLAEALAAEVDAYMSRCGPAGSGGSRGSSHRCAPQRMARSRRPRTGTARRRGRGMGAGAFVAAGAAPAAEPPAARHVTTRYAASPPR